MNWSERITMDSDVCHGKPCIGGLRYPVAMILDLLGSGISTEEILADYSDLKSEDILACRQFAARLRELQTLAKDVA